MHHYGINSLAPGKSLCDFRNVIFNLALLIGIFRSSYDNVLRWMPQDLTDDKSTLVQAMAWCCQVTSHYLNQCWPWSQRPYGITRPQWINPCAEFVFGIIMVYLHFLSFIHIEMAQVFEIPPCERQGLICFVPWSGCVRQAPGVWNWQIPA